MGGQARRSRMGLGCVVLAAGGSRRLGLPKQFVRHRSHTLLTRTARLAQKAADAGIVIVIGAHAARARRALRRDAPEAILVNNQRWARGIGSSLRAGLDALPTRAGAALILLVDQPLVGRSALNRLVAAWRLHPLTAAAARYAGQPGVPAILPRRLWPLIGNDGDSGARSILRQLDRLTLVEMPEAACDIDTPADLTALG